MPITNIVDREFADWKLRELTVPKIVYSESEMPPSLCLLDKGSPKAFYNMVH